MGRSFKHIETINYEALEFLSAFRRFRGVCNNIDQTLCANLLKIVSGIDDFLNNKPKEISDLHSEHLNPAELDKFVFRKSIFCKKCRLEFGNSFEHISSHLKSDRHQRVSKEVKNGTIATKAKLENKVLPKKALGLMQGDLQTFCTTNLDVAEKLTILPDYDIIEKELLALLSPKFPDQSIKVYMFGSRISGIANALSDLDIFIDIGDVFNKFENRASPETVNKLQIVEKVLEKNANWSRLNAVKNARVPILKVLHKQTALNCDLGFSNSLGFCNTKLMQYLLELQPIAKALTVVLKRFLKLTKLNEYITTYSMVLLVVTYLQKKNLLPSVKTLQDGLDDPVEIGPWMGAFAQKTLIDLHIPTASILLHDFRNELKLFFKFYSSFDFENNLVCPYLGQTIRIANLECCPLLPRYVKYVDTEAETKYTQLEKNFMNVQDPFQLNHNVTKAVPTTVVSLLKQYFQMAAAAIENVAVPQQASNVENLIK